MPELQNVLVPDYGEAADVTVAEVLVAPGSAVAEGDPVVVLETDKASMEIPSPAAGRVHEVLLSAGDPVSVGTLILTLEAAGDDVAGRTDVAAPPAAAPTAPETPTPASVPEMPAPKPAPAPSVSPPAPPAPAAEAPGALPHASPAVRRFARELGADLSRVRGSGRKGRITKEDVQEFVKRALVSGAAAAGGSFEWPRMPEIDFSKFGPVEVKPLGRIRRSSAANLHRSWLHVPHVTQFDEADITELEAFRKEHAEEAASQGVKLTLLAFLVKAVAQALHAFPEMNSSLDPSGEALIIKKYCHIGVAVDTPNGLVVPVLRDVPCKGVYELARELGETSQRARDGKLLPADFQGGCFTISSLGGIGGTAFTPIVNAPEVAILGVSRAQMKPVWREGETVARLMLPLSLSYDHRVIDGAAAVRFTTHLAGLLGDIRDILL